MPFYEYYNTDTDERWEAMRSYTAHLSFLEENPHIKQIICAPAIVSGVSGARKVDSGFNDVLQRIASNNPHSPLAQEYGNKGIKESKTREVVNKHREIQSK